MVDMFCIIILSFAVGTIILVIITAFIVHTLPYKYGGWSEWKYYDTEQLIGAPNNEIQKRKNKTTGETQYRIEYYGYWMSFNKNR